MFPKRVNILEELSDPNPVNWDKIHIDNQMFYKHSHSFIFISNYFIKP